jgi:uroporphyrinogen-III synthase
VSGVAAPSLRGRRIVTTRDEPGELDELLTARGAAVVHVPLIEIAEPSDGGAALSAVLATLEDADWLIVTSRHGAARVGDAAARFPHLRLAAVGTRTAAELSRRAGRAVDVVAERQTAVGLLAVMPPDGRGARVVVAHADRAEPTLVDGLLARGYEVSAAIAYRTLLRVPTPEERAAALAADAVAFASGSAAEAWAQAVGADTPPRVVAIGPTTAAAAARHGLRVTHVADEHSVPGLVAAIEAALSETGRSC